MVEPRAIYFSFFMIAIKPAIINKTKGNAYIKLIEIMPPMALASISQPPNFVLLFTNAAPVMPNIANSIAAHPKLTSVEASFPPKDEYTLPKNKTNPAPRKPRVPPNIPKTNSTVLFSISPTTPLVVLIEGPKLSHQNQF